MSICWKVTLGTCVICSPVYVFIDDVQKTAFGRTLGYACPHRFLPNEQFINGTSALRHYSLTHCWKNTYWICGILIEQCRPWSNLQKENSFCVIFLQHGAYPNERSNDVFLVKFSIANMLVDVAQFCQRMSRLNCVIIWKAPQGMTFRCVRWKCDLWCTSLQRSLATQELGQPRPRMARLSLPSWLVTYWDS